VYDATCDICGHFIGNYEKEEDAKAAVSFHKNLHHKSE
jgi:hypothetical protein